MKVQVTHLETDGESMERSHGLASLCKVRVELLGTSKSLVEHDLGETASQRESIECIGCREWGGYVPVDELLRDGRPLYPASVSVVS